MESPPLSTILPALDLVMSRPTDTAHSEYGGITKLMHLLLLEAILTPQAKVVYTNLLRKIPSPPGWSRLQSPAFHMGSYRLQEHAR